MLIRAPMAEYLRDGGYRVFEAADTAEAKAMLNADTPVDLVFTDVNMPGAENGLILAGSRAFPQYQGDPHFRRCKHHHERRRPAYG